MSAFWKTAAILFGFVSNPGPGIACCPRVNEFHFCERMPGEFKVDQIQV